MARVYLQDGKEVSLPQETTDDYRLCLQWVLFVYDDGSSENGYRFIWRRPDGSLQPARGQARIPSLNTARRLMKMAEDQGWGDQVAHDAARFE